MSHQTTRRDFLKTTAVWGVGAGLGMHAHAYAQVVGSNEKLNIGVIGVAGRGGGNLRGVSIENIVALCDIDKKSLSKAAGRFKEAKTYLDYRELIEQKDLDAVVVSTPDHNHAPATLRALRRGLHVYCEKPLTHTVHEARLVAETARKMKVATQMGTQHHQGEGYLRTIELIKSGSIGPVTEVHVQTDRPGGWWKQGLHRPKETPPVPPHIDWDLWLGPAPVRPYHKIYVPFHWRGWWDFGCGAIGDMAIHLMDAAFWALDLGGPVKVSTEGPKVLPEAGPTWMKVTFEFPARGKLPACKVIWYEGTAKPDDHVKAELPMNGSLFIGQEGRIAVKHTSKTTKLLPEEKFKAFVPPSAFLPRSEGHHKQWIAACKGGKPASCNFNYAGPFAELVLLGNVSYRVGKTIDWEPKTMTAKGVPEAQSFIRKTYRKGWEL